MSEMWGPDGGGGFYRTAASRRGREDLAPQWVVTLLGIQGAAGWFSGDGLASAKDPNSETHDLTFVGMDTFLANF